MSPGDSTGQLRDDCWCRLGKDDIACEGRLPSSSPNEEISSARTARRSPASPIPRMLLRRSGRTLARTPLFTSRRSIASFWQLVRPFQNDIKEWIGKRIDERLAELRDKAANFGPRVRQATRDANKRDIERYEEQRRTYTRNARLTYGTGSDGRVPGGGVGAVLLGGLDRRVS